MAYDEELAERIRQLIPATRPVTEQKMFGGLAFLVGGNMAVAASGEGGLLVRVDRDESDHLIATTGAQEVVMGGRARRGWLRVPASEVDAEAQLRAWVERGIGGAASLPPKAGQA